MVLHVIAPVEYHDPQIKNCRNIMAMRRTFKRLSIGCGDERSACHQCLYFDQEIAALDLAGFFSALMRSTNCFM
jgi:hypothetical protein